MSEQKQKAFYIISIVFAAVYILNEIAKSFFVVFYSVPVIFGIMSIVFIVQKRYTVFASIFYGFQMLRCAIRLMSLINIIIEYSNMGKVQLNWIYFICEILQPVIITILFILVIKYKRTDRQVGCAAALITFCAINQNVFVEFSTIPGPAICFMLIAVIAAVTILVITNTGNNKLQKSNDVII